MKRNFTNEQIISTLRQVEGGTSVAEVCRKTAHHRADILPVEEEVCRNGRR